MTVYVQNPEVTLARAAAFYGTGPLTSMLRTGVEDYVRLVLGASAAKVIDPNAPVVVGFSKMVGSSQPEFAVSFGLRDGYERANRDKAFDVLPEDFAPDARPGRAPTCTEFLAPDGSPRLICAQNRQSLWKIERELRAVSLNANGMDLRFEIRGSLFRSIAKDVQAEAPAEPAEQAGKQVVIDAFESMHAIGFGVRLEMDHAFLAADVSIAERKGLLAQLLLGSTAISHPGRVAKVPEDTYLLVTTTGIERDALANAAEPLWRGMQLDMERGEPRAKVDLAVAQLKQIFVTGGPSFFLAGPTGVGTREPARLAMAKKPKLPASSESGVSSGWWAFGVDEPIDKWLSAYRKIQALDAQRFDLAAGEGPKQSIPERTITVSTEVKLKSTALPAESAHVTFLTKPNPVYQLREGETPAVASLTHVFVVADGNTTYLVGSKDERLALARAQFLASKNSADIAAPVVWYKQPRANVQTRALGFVTPRGVLMSWLAADDDVSGEEAKRYVERLAMLPQKGDGQLAFEYFSQNSGDGSTGTLEVRLDADLVRALSGLLTMYWGE